LDIHSIKKNETDDKGSDPEMVLEVQKAAIYENPFPDRSERDKILTKILKCFPTKEQTSKVSGYIYMEWLWESTSCI
jgi:hypothetical protein